MKRKLYLSLTACFFFVFAWSQTRQVTGRVLSDSSRLGLGGVNVTVKGTNTGTTTNNEGNFSISVPDRNNIVLVFSSVGFLSNEVALNGRSSVDVTMSSSSAALDVV